jgi:hypothetical protein
LSSPLLKTMVNVIIEVSEEDYQTDLAGID